MTTSHPAHTDGRNHSVCDGDAAGLTVDEAQARLSSLAGWELRDGKLHRTFRCTDFAESIALVDRIAQISESLNHHPNFAVTDKRQVSLVVWTHKMNCLTAMDFELAASIEAAFGEKSAPAGAQS